MARERGIHVLMVPAWWPSVERPGAGIFFVDFVEALVGVGIRVGVVYPDLVSIRTYRRQTRVPVWPRVSFEETCGASVVRIRGLHTALGMPGPHMRRFRRWLGRGIAEYESRFGRVDLLHAMCAIPSGWACLGLGRPFVLTEHSGPPAAIWRKPGESRMARAALAGADRVTTVSKLNQAALREAGIAREIQVCGNPVASVFTEREGVEQARGQAARLLFVGRMTQEKGIRELVAAAVELRERALEWHFAGPGPLEDWVRCQFHGAGMADRFRLHGHLDRPALANLMGESDLMVFPSYRETFGLAVAEALCAGLAVVTTREAACGEFIDEENGILVRAGDRRGLVEGILSAVGRLDQFDGARIGMRARERFAATAVGQFYRSLYGELLQNPVRTRAD